MNVLRKHRVPVYYSSVPLEARGRESLEEVIVSRVDKHWRPKPGSDKKIAADLLCLNFGFIPSTYFSHMAGCEHTCDPRSRGWLPKIDSKNETSEKGIFAAGDCTGVGGVKKAVLEGELVGNEVARQLGRFPGADADEQIRVLQKKIRRRLWYQQFLRAIYSFRPGLLDLVSDETIICRCEEVDFGTISDLIENEPSSLEKIKLQVRTGMGRCQGRFCYPTLLGFLSKTLSDQDLCQQDFTARVPVKPLPLEKFTDLSSPK
jgi:NADPH-dependent 2,4-dienoyl-CoA reductase/sulfur reductase-like enzyme